MKEQQKEFHLKEAKGCFNKAWDYIDKETRTVQEEIQMVTLAHASAYHWLQVGGPEQFQASQWQLSKVYLLTGDAKLALKHAKECFRICEENDIKDFNISFAYEALAHAYKLLGDIKNLELNKEKAYKSLDNIEKADDKDYTKSQLELI